MGFGALQPLDTHEGISYRAKDNEGAQFLDCITLMTGNPWADRIYQKPFICTIVCFIEIITRKTAFTINVQFHYHPVT